MTLRRTLAGALLGLLVLGPARARDPEPAPATDARATEGLESEAPVFPDRPIGLEEALALALAHNPRVVAAHADVRSARAETRRAEGSDDPRLTASGSYTRLEDKPSFTIPGMGTLVYGERNNWDLGLRLQIPIFTAGRTGAYKDQAEAMLDAAVAAAARERQSVARDAVAAYFTVMKAADMVEVAEEHHKAMAAQHDAVTRMHGVGLVAKLDPLRSEVALRSAEEMVTKARNGHAVALAALRAALGAPEDWRPAVSGEYREVELPANLDAALAEAKARRPEVAMMAGYRRAAEAGADMADAGNDPQLGLFAQWDFLRSSAMPETGRWAVGIGMSWNITDGKESSSAEEQARARIERVDAETQSLMDGITLQVTQALLNLGAARERVRTTEAGLASADEAVQLAAVSYANELIPLTDLLSAEAARAQAKSDYAAALYDARTATAEFVFALGR